MCVYVGYYSTSISNERPLARLLPCRYIMGVAPGVKTEFWEFPAQDFCGDMHNYTTTMITGDDQPVVHSISYGWQGNLSKINCKASDLDVIDSNFAKAAAKVRDARRERREAR